MYHEVLLQLTLGKPLGNATLIFCYILLVVSYCWRIRIFNNIQLGICWIARGISYSRDTEIWTICIAQFAFAKFAQTVLFSPCQSSPFCWEKTRAQRKGNLVIDTFQRNPPKEVETAVSSMVVQARNFFFRQHKKGNPIFSRKVCDATRRNYDQREIGCVE